jgi:hypothetical protein
MSNEKKKEEIHIFSAGENIINTFKVAKKKFHIDQIMVFKEQMEGSKNNRDDEAIENAIKELRNRSKEDDIKFSEEKVKGNDMDDVMEKIVRIKKEHAGDSFYFNLTSGRKVLALYLYTMAIWLDGIPYYVDKSQDVIRFEIPKIQREVLMKNSEYVKILRIVYDATRGYDEQIKYMDVFAKLETDFNTTAKTRNGEVRKLIMGTFSKWIRELTDRELLNEKYRDKNHKVKYLEITDNGIYALKFYRDL